MRGGLGLSVLVAAAAGLGGLALLGYSFLRAADPSRRLGEEFAQAAERGDFEAILAAFEGKEKGVPEAWEPFRPLPVFLDLEDPSLRTLAGSGANAITIVEPLRRSADLRPTVRWLAPPGERRYAVLISEARGAPAIQVETAATEFEFPPEKPALRHGWEYWLEVRDAEGTLSPGHTQVRIAWKDDLEESARRLEELRALVGEGAAHDFFATHHFKRAGLPLEALRRLRRLEGRFPDSPYLHRELAALYRDSGIGPPLARELERLRRRP